METIKNYLETMFMNLPNTPEVRRAKDELGQMMEDKFVELTEAGKTENEAVGTVISEFGNLNEVADALGIDSYVNPKTNNTSGNENGVNQSAANDAAFTGATVNQAPPRMISSDEVRQYLRDKSAEAFMTAFGVLLCIVCVTGPIIFDAIPGLIASLGVMIMFLCIGFGVALFILSGFRASKWKYIKETRCAIDFATFNEVKKEQERYSNIHAVLITIGVLLCCICFVPAAVIDEIGYLSVGMDLGSIGGASLFWLVGIGVFLIVLGSIKFGGYKRILSVNDASTMGGNYTPAKEHHSYSNKKVEAVMSVYWSTVTCGYLIWSFLTYDWHITWIVWPIAAIVQVVINNIFGEE